MSKFTLKQVTSGKFRIMDGVDTVGSISVDPSQVNDLLRHWSGSTDCLAAKAQPQQSQKQNPFVAAIMKARARGVSRECILRGC